MYTIAVVNEKGGTGKTTTAVNLAAALGELQHKVLLVDLDGQAASSRWLGVEDDTSFADALYSGKGLQPLPDVIPNVSLAPASGKLDAVAHDLRPTQGGQLRKLLQELSDQFEYCIIDCPPSLGNRLIGNALLAASHAIVPVETSILALDGLKILLTTLDDVREGFGHNIGLAGVLACRFDGRTRLSHLVLAELKRALPGKVFDTVIRENVRMRECPASGKSILDYASDSHAAEDYRKLAKELVASDRLIQTQEADYQADRAAFQAADESMRFGDMLRQSVRKIAQETTDSQVLKSPSEGIQDDWRGRLEEAQRRLSGEQPVADAFELPACGTAGASTCGAGVSPARPEHGQEPQADNPVLQPPLVETSSAVAAGAVADATQERSVGLQDAPPAVMPSDASPAPATTESSAETPAAWESWLTGQATSNAQEACHEAAPPLLAEPPAATDAVPEAPADSPAHGDDMDGATAPASARELSAPAADQDMIERNQQAQTPAQDVASPAAPLWEDPAPTEENVDTNCPNLRRLLETMDWNKAAVEPKHDAKQPNKKGLLRRFLGK